MSTEVDTIQPITTSPTTTTTTTSTTSSPSNGTVDIKDKFIYGNLEVKVKEVRGCQCHFLNGKCELKILKTDVKPKALPNHFFVDVFNFRVSGPTSELEIEAWKKNLFFKDKMAGKLTLPINDLLNAKGEQKWYPLSQNKKRTNRIKPVDGQQQQQQGNPDENAKEKQDPQSGSEENNNSEQSEGRARSVSLPATAATKKAKPPAEVLLEITFVLNEPPKEILKGIVLDGEWNEQNNFGSLINNPHWIKCSQYLLTVKEDQVPLIIKLRQPKGIDQRVSFFVINYDSFYNGSKKVILDTTNDIKKVDNFTCPIPASSIDCSIELEKGQYIIIPYAETFGFKGSYKLNIDSEKLDQLELNLLPKSEELQWKEITIDGLWKSENNGGADINVVTNWTKNPQYLFNLSKKSRACVLLSQDDNEKSIGFYVIKQVDQGKRAIEFRDTVGKTESFKFVCSAGCTMTLEQGNYIVIPSTFDSGIEGAFHLTLFTDDREATFAPLTSEWKEVEQAKGTWVGKSAGGAPNNGEKFFHNPQFHLKVEPSSEEQTLVIQLIQDSTIADESIGFVVLTREDHSKPQSADTFQNEMIFVKTNSWEQRNDISCKLIVKPDQSRDFTIIPSTFKEGVNRSFRIQVFSEISVNLDEIETSDSSEDEN
ncbi:calpain-like cysteine protease [Tieghemostelium lacteum]|uniref:Calpain-like cysteine protease n=1 Tax=Tieghemostelium lacteum TaxID=361077 RepID=A0A152A8I9_TIELA|nr:calpain-like cysteine protease [Tieghemostelium lacteum]|eukprot:KYR02538.1 calpain-like cysteine protease [Tieghemostelium lacteum]